MVGLFSFYKCQATWGKKQANRAGFHKTGHISLFIHLASALIKLDKSLSASGFASTLARCCQLLLWVSSVCVCKMLMSFEIRQLSPPHSQLNNELLICHFPPEKTVATFCFVVQSCCQCVRFVHLSEFQDQGICLGGVHVDHS